MTDHEIKDYLLWFVVLCTTAAGKGLAFIDIFSYLYKHFVIRTKVRYRFITHSSPRGGSPMGGSCYSIRSAILDAVIGKQYPSVYLRYFCIFVFWYSVQIKLVTYLQ